MYPFFFIADLMLFEILTPKKYGDYIAEGDDMPIYMGLGIFVLIVGYFLAISIEIYISEVDSFFPIIYHK